VGGEVQEGTRTEGHWRGSRYRTSDLPWPVPSPAWDGRTAFLDALARAEARAEAMGFRGFSLCRLCGCRNGSVEYRLGDWRWPSGYRHYVADHDVRPSRDFERFIAHTGPLAPAPR
jgi:hypothetical protein